MEGPARAHSRNTGRFGGVALAAALALSAASCGGGGGGGGDTTKPTADSGTVAAAPRGGSGEARLVNPSPQLPFGVWYMDAADWEEFIFGKADEEEEDDAKGLRFEDDFKNKLAVRVRRKADPDGSGKFTVLALYPQEGTYLLDTTETFFPSGRPGRVIAKIVNEGARPEHGMNIPAGATAFWVVERERQSGGKPGKLISYIVTFKAGFRPVIKKRLAFRLCHRNDDTKPPSRIAIIDPGTCDVRLTVEPFMINGRRIRQLGNSPWFPCVQGCCIAANLEQAGQIPKPMPKPCTGKECTPVALLEEL